MAVNPGKVGGRPPASGGGGPLASGGGGPPGGGGGPPANGFDDKTPGKLRSEDPKKFCCKESIPNEFPKLDEVEVAMLCCEKFPTSVVEPKENEVGATFFISPY